nr:unnamed protein product [Callosobruchus chinensis]
MTCTYLPIPVKEKHEDLMRKSLEIILKNVFEGTKKDAKVCNFIHPKELFQTMDLELKWCQSTHECLLKAVEDILKYSHKTGNIWFLNQIFACVDPYGLIGGFLTDAINVSVFTYEVSPVVIVMEDVILRNMRKAVGWPDGKGDGIFTPGGSMSNGYGKKGVLAYPRLVSFVSEDAHYSTKKFTAFQGMGSDNVYSIKTDDRGIMIVSDLVENIERALKEGAKPFLTQPGAEEYSCPENTGARWLASKGDKHVQCGRRADVLKFWFMWKAKGWSGFEKHVDKIFENAEYFVNKINKRPDFELIVNEPECTNVCFFYLPPSIRNMDKNDPTYKEKLHKIAPKMKERMMLAGTMMVAYQAIRGLPNFWRVLFQNSAMDKPDIDLLIQRFEDFGKDL